MCLWDSFHVGDAEGEVSQCDGVESVLLVSVKLGQGLQRTTICLWSGESCGPVCRPAHCSVTGDWEESSYKHL